MTPLGLAHIMYNGHHYGPMPWGNTLNRPDWNPVYYHKADASGIGFDRTAKGTNALSQYAVEVQNEFNDINKCPDEYLLWFHHARGIIKCIQEEHCGMNSAINIIQELIQ
jgi:alpha-glucuronidase